MSEQKISPTVFKESKTYKEALEKIGIDIDNNGKSPDAQDLNKLRFIKDSIVIFAFPPDGSEITHENSFFMLFKRKKITFLKSGEIRVKDGWLDQLYAYKVIILDDEKSKLINQWYQDHMRETSRNRQDATGHMPEDDSLGKKKEVYDGKANATEGVDSFRDQSRVYTRPSTKLHERTPFDPREETFKKLTKKGIHTYTTVQPEFEGILKLEDTTIFPENLRTFMDEVFNRMRMFSGLDRSKCKIVFFDDFSYIPAYVFLAMLILPNPQRNYVTLFDRKLSDCRFVYNNEIEDAIKAIIVQMKNNIDFDMLLEQATQFLEAYNNSLLEQNIIVEHGLPLPAERAPLVIPEPPPPGIFSMGMGAFGEAYKSVFKREGGSKKKKTTKKSRKEKKPSARNHLRRSKRKSIKRQQYPPGTQENYNSFSSRNPITEKGKEL